MVYQWRGLEYYQVYVSSISQTLTIFSLLVPLQTIQLTLSIYRLVNDLLCCGYVSYAILKLFTESSLVDDYCEMF